MTYAEALAYLDSFINLERGALDRSARAVITLDSVRLVAERLGNPQNTFKSIHVAGTKGKGSTCAIAERILREAGLKTGLYTSPHLHDVRERIQLNGELISETDFARLLNQMRPVLEDLRNPPEGQRRPTYFEILTHLAFLYFAEQQVDIAVLEVGLGGRLDATNIVTPVACAITNISLDHQAILGETLAEIAREKAGIFKRGVPAISANQKPKVLDTLEDCADAAETPLLILKDSVRTELTNLGYPACVMRTPDGRTFGATLTLRGTFQAENWALAVHLADIAHQSIRGTPLDEATVRSASRAVKWPGRLEETWIERTSVFFDGAHNDHSLQTVLNEIDLRTKGEPLHVVFGCAKDKNIDAMIDVLRERKNISSILFTQADHTRAASPHDLLKKWKNLTSRPATAMEPCTTALQSAVTLAKSTSGNVLVTGSLYLVGALRKLGEPVSIARSPDAPPEERFPIEDAIG